MKRKIFVVANPGAGTKRIENVLRELVDYSSSKGYDYDVFLTAKSRNATKTVRDNFEESHSDLVILGGDGTINEAINGLVYDRPVGIIPCGSANDFVKNIHIGKETEEQIHTALNGKKIRIDIGLCNKRKFVNGVGIGFDGQIVHNLIHSKTRVKGPLKYYFNVLKILASYRAKSTGYKIGREDYTKDLILLTIGNGTTFGGSFKLMPNAKIDDGLLDICAIGKIPGLIRFFHIPKLKGGTHIHLKQVDIYQSKSVKIEEQPLLKAHIDGEYLGHPPFNIKMLPLALTIRVK